MWRWLGLFLLTSCVYAEDACASITGDASRMRCYKRQATSQKKAPTQKASVPKAQASANTLTVPSIASSNPLTAAPPTTSSKMPSKNTTVASSETNSEHQGMHAHASAQDTSSMRPIGNLNASGSGSYSESATSSPGSASVNASEGVGFYAYENDGVGVERKAFANHSKALKQNIASSSQHNAPHAELASAQSKQSLEESASHAMGQQPVEVLDMHVFYHNNVQGGADDTLPSIQGTWGE